MFFPIRNFKTKEPINYLLTYCSNFLRITLVKNHSNSIFRQFCIFIYGSIPKKWKPRICKNFYKIDITLSLIFTDLILIISHLEFILIWSRDSFFKSSFIKFFFLKWKIAIMTSFFSPKNNSDQLHLNIQPIWNCAMSLYCNRPWKGHVIKGYRTRQYNLENVFSNQLPKLL